MAQPSLGAKAAVGGDGTGSRSRPGAGGSIAGFLRQRPVQLLLLVTVAGAALRFATLDVQSIWLDEAATIDLVHKGFSGMLSDLPKSESAPPLYYLLVWCWTRVFGSGPIAFRSLSALAGTLTIPALYWAGAVRSRRIGLWAATLCAFSPAMFYYSQEARAYGLMIMFSAWALAFWLHAMDSPRGRLVWGWAATSALALLSHYFAVFPFIPEAALLFWRHGPKRTVRPAALVGAVGAALIPLAYAQASTGGKLKWIEESSLGSRVLETGKLFLVGVYGPVELFTATALAVVALAALWRLRRADRPTWQFAARLATVGAIALLLPLAIAAIHLIDVFDGRNMLESWPIFALLVAAGIAAVRPRAYQLLSGAAIVSVFLGVIAATEVLPAYQRDDWRGAAKSLPPAEGQRLLVAEDFSAIPLSVYLPSISTVLPGKASAGDRTVRTREVVFIALRQRKTFGSPEPPAPPHGRLPGFAGPQIASSEAWATARYVAPGPRTVALSALRALAGQADAEVMVANEKSARRP